MIRLACFDFDGVLVDCVSIHFASLNNAIYDTVGKPFIIEDHETDLYNGLPTKEKLLMLSKYKKLPTESHKEIFERKQKHTIDLMHRDLNKDESKIDIFKWLRIKNIKTCCVSNAIEPTIKLGLEKIGVRNYIDFYVCNTDVELNKPNPQCYLWAFMYANVKAENSIIFEDSLPGKIAAGKSGGKLVPVKDPHQLTLPFVQEWFQIYDF